MYEFVGLYISMAKSVHLRNKNFDVTHCSTSDIVPNVHQNRRRACKTKTIHSDSHVV